MILQLQGGVKFSTGGNDESLAHERCMRCDSNLVSLHDFGVIPKPTV